jgi:myo-inositol-1(or 4)-monophosphatase
MEETLKEALETSGKILLNSFENENKAETKENQSQLVTVIDKLSENKILEIIEKKYPGHNILSEESGYKCKKSNITWVIDPLDGTSNFSSHVPWFGVIITVFDTFEPILGGVYLPFYNLLYIAVKGKGCYKNNKKIVIGNEKDLKKVLFAYSVDYSADLHKTKSDSLIYGKLVSTTCNIRATNSVLDHCFTADGRFGGSINQCAKIWDIAASYLIIKEANGIVSDIYGNEINFYFDETNYERNFTFFCSNKYLHNSVIELIRDILL